jgi:hypothetical protein
MIRKVNVTVFYNIKLEQIIFIQTQTYCEEMFLNSL